VAASLGERPLRALLLDLDDTILDDRGGRDAAWERVAGLLAERAGLARDAVWTDLDRQARWFWSDAERHRRGRLDLVAARTEIVGRVIEAAGRRDDETAREAALRWTAERERAQRLHDGALDALAALRRRVSAMALVTNGAADAQRAKVVRFRLDAFFDHVQIEGEFGAGKPERVVYEHVLAVVGADPDEALMVGDSYEADVLGSLEAGLHAAWVDSARVGRPPHPAPRPHLTIPHIANLLPHLPAN